MIKIEKIWKGREREMVKEKDRGRRGEREKKVAETNKRASAKRKNEGEKE